jgi:hypothetical protein
LLRLRPSSTVPLSVVFVVVSLGVGLQRTQRKIIEFSDDSTTVRFSEQAQSDLILSSGVNVALGSDVVFGLAGLLRREWTSPGVTNAVEVCTEVRGPGALNVPLCEDRYTNGLRDYWAGQVRADVLWRVMPLGGARSAPHLAVIGSSSMDVGQDASARWNVGTGIGVAPLRYPGHLIVALFMELYDVTDANAEAPDFADRLVTRIVLGIPFDLLVN